MNNSCGTCTMCCKLLGIVELNKPACTWCAHAEVGVGCRVYDSRPQSCKDFACLWLQSQGDSGAMPLDMRPDRSHVVLDATTDGQGLVAHVSPDRAEAYQKGAVGVLLGGLIRKGVRVYLVAGERRLILAGRQPPG